MSEPRVSQSSPAQLRPRGHPAKSANSCFKSLMELRDCSAGGAEKSKGIGGRTREFRTAGDSAPPDCRSRLERSLLCGGVRFAASVVVVGKNFLVFNVDTAARLFWNISCNRRLTLI